MRPTRGCAAALLAALVLHLLTRTVDSAWLALASGAALALPVAALLLRPRLDVLEVAGTAVRARVGDAVDVVLQVRNAGRRWSPALRLTDTTGGLSRVVVAVPALAPGATVSVATTRSAVARGVWEQGEARLTSAAPFGLVQAARTTPVSGRVVVAPERVPARLPAAGGAGAGDRAHPESGSGSEVLGLRPFRAGDPARAVHARASARTGRLVVLERERETGPALVVLCTGPGHDADWERAVAQSCALAEQALAAGRPARLLAGGSAEPVRPDLAAVLDWHAELDRRPTADPGTTEAAVRAAARGGTLVLLAPDAASAAVAEAAGRAAGARTVVLGQPWS